MSQTLAPSDAYAFHADLTELVGTIQPESITSRQVHHDDAVKVTLFGFAAGQELSEHTASKPAILQVLAGEGTFGLGGAVVEVRPGSWAHMAPHLPHTVTARTPMVMLLTMLKAPPAEARS
jgi:quercetin dioxygenase-like cupin family protein